VTVEDLLERLRGVDPFLDVEIHVGMKGAGGIIRAAAETSRLKKPFARGLVFAIETEGCDFDDPNGGMC
jgi:hypothetical protein